MQGKLRLGTIFGLVVAGSIAVGGIDGSVHDFSNESWSLDETCIVCHTPHGADTAAVQAPLWNHAITSATFTLYSSLTLTETPSQPQGVSKLCLSCHDGSVAIDSFAGMSGSTFISGDAKLETDLRDDHPISIKWTHQNEIASCSQCHSTHGGAAFISELPFYDGYVECASCHDVHDRAAFPMLLRMTQQGSALCLHCHGK